jgi:hypothetical protein
MENIILVKLFIDFGNYLLSVNVDESKKQYIREFVIEPIDKMVLVNLYKDDEIQIIEWIKTFGLLDNDKVKNKLREYLNELLKYKTQSFF